MDPLPERLVVAAMPTPIGLVCLVTDERATLRALAFVDSDGEATLHRVLRRQYRGITLDSGTVPGSVRDALAAYFAGDLAALGRIPWATGGTPFQQTIWAALTAIPVGTTLTYAALAAYVGAPRAVRAVGHANGANPISLVVPCHRLIGANGTLTGYGGGLDRKRWLLAHEGAMASTRHRSTRLPYGTGEHAHVPHQ